MEHETDLSKWHCPTCGSDAVTPYCGNCGERRLAAGDLSLAHYVEAAAESVFSWDGRVVRTLASFVRRPGELTMAYLEGRRKPFLNPLQLFLLINVLFFLQQGITGWNTYSTPLGVHLTQSLYIDEAKALVRFRFDQLGISYAGADAQAYGQRFNAAVRLSAKSLVVLLVPFVTLLLATVRLGRPSRAVVHVTAGFYVTAYLLALQTVVLPCLTGLEVASVALGTPLDRYTIDDLSGWLLNVGMLVILVPMLERVFDAPRRWALLQGALLAWGIGLCVQGYRFILFLLTLFTTS